MGLILYHLDAYLIGLTNLMVKRGSYSFLHIGAYLIGLTNPMAESESYFFLHIGAYLIGLTNPNYRKWVLPFPSYIDACLIGDRAYKSKLSKAGLIL